MITRRFGGRCEFPRVISMKVRGMTGEKSMESDDAGDLARFHGNFDMDGQWHIEGGWALRLGDGDYEQVFRHEPGKIRVHIVEQADFCLPESITGLITTQVYADPFVGRENVWVVEDMDKPQNPFYYFPVDDPLDGPMGRVVLATGHDVVQWHPVDELVFDSDVWCQVEQTPTLDVLRRVSDLSQLTGYFDSQRHVSLYDTGLLQPDEYAVWERKLGIEQWRPGAVERLMKQVVADAHGVLSEIIECWRQSGQAGVEDEFGDPRVRWHTAKMKLAVAGFVQHVAMLEGAYDDDSNDAGRQSQKGIGGLLRKVTGFKRRHPGLKELPPAGDEYSNRNDEYNENWSRQDSLR